MVWCPAFSGFYPITPLIGVEGGVSMSFDGTRAVEYGFGVPGVSV